MIEDPRERFIAELRRELHGGPLTRRRLLAEITAHLDDTVVELEARGWPEPVAVQEAVRRMGDVGTIAVAFRDVPASRPRTSRARWLRSPAWIAVGAMSLATAWAAELPQASGAKATQSVSGRSQLSGTAPPPLRMPEQPVRRPARSRRSRLLRP